MRLFLMFILFSVIGLFNQAVIDPGTNSETNEITENLIEDTSNESTDNDNEDPEEENVAIESSTVISTNTRMYDGSTEESIGDHPSGSFPGNFPPNAIPYCYPYPYSNFNDSPEERSMSKGIGWAAATAILIFAFSNTVIVGATVVVTYVLYQVLISALAIVAPEVAGVFTNFISMFTFL